MELQRTMSGDITQSIASRRSLATLVAASPCEHMRSADVFDARCDVRRESAALIDCVSHAGEPCHVKNTSIALRRMADMGKLPTSAFLHLGRSGVIHRLLARVRTQTALPEERAKLLVAEFAVPYRIGRKLASMFVSAMSFPALSGGISPWFPEVDGSKLVVVDTNVRQAIRLLSPEENFGTYEACVAAVHRLAGEVDMREYSSAVPRFAPRLAQQALYLFRSRSNRRLHGDPCSLGPCAACVPDVCPFA
jgi:hypothetical protein